MSLDPKVAGTVVEFVEVASAIAKYAQDLHQEKQLKEADAKARQQKLVTLKAEVLEQLEKSAAVKASQRDDIAADMDSHEGTLHLLLAAGGLLERRKTAAEEASQKLHMGQGKSSHAKTASDKNDRVRVSGLRSPDREARRQENIEKIFNLS